MSVVPFSFSCGLILQPILRSMPPNIWAKYASMEACMEISAMEIFPTYMSTFSMPRPAASMTPLISCGYNRILQAT